MAQPNRKHIEDQMLSGCFLFVWYSMGCFLLTIWPFFLLLESHKFQSLLTCLLLGLTPVAIAGAHGSRRFGIPAAAGFVASSMATGIFLYIRLNEMFLAAQADRISEPDYPHALAWGLPLAWVAASFLIATYFLRPGEIPTDEP